MLTWEYLNILSYGAGTPSTTLALMSCQNARHGPPYPYPEVPIYDAVIFCDLHSEPSWVYKQAEFTAAVCAQVGIPFYRLDSNLYRDFTRNFGRARTACIPFWTMGEDGKKGRMPRQCTYDYKIKVIEKFVRYELLCYKPRQRTLPYDVHAHNLHMGIMWEERHRATESKQTLFTKQYPLVKWAGHGKSVLIITNTFGASQQWQAAVCSAHFIPTTSTSTYGNTSQTAMLAPSMWINLWKYIRPAHR